MMAAGRQPDRRALTGFLPRHPGMIADLAKVAVLRVIRGQGR
jgi:hypothetical protein